MEEILIKCGLQHAIAIFAENAIKPHHMNIMADSELRELLPRMADRILLKAEIENSKKRRGSTGQGLSNKQKSKHSGKTGKNTGTRPVDKKKHKNSGKTRKSTGPKPSGKKKPKELHKLVKAAHESLTEKSYKLLKKNVPAFFEGMPKIKRSKWISVTAYTKKGLTKYDCTITCPICARKYTPQYREVRKGKYDFQLGTFRVHLLSVHVGKDNAKQTKSACEKVNIKANVSEEGTDTSSSDGSSCSTSTRSTTSTRSSSRSSSITGSSDVSSADSDSSSGSSSGSGSGSGLSSGSGSELSSDSGSGLSSGSGSGLSSGSGSGSSSGSRSGSSSGSSSGSDSTDE